MSVSLDSGSLEAVVGSLEVAVVVVVVEVAIEVVFAFSVVAFAAVAFAAFAAVAFAAVAFAAFAASAIAVAAKTAVAVQESNLLKTEADLAQEPKWVVAFATVQAVSGSEPDSRDASLPLKWKPNYSLGLKIDYKCYKCYKCM
jgi:hypothetical protein